MPKNSTSVFEGTAQLFPSIIGFFNIVSLPKDYLLPTSTTVGTGTLYRLNSLTIAVNLRSKGGGFRLKVVQNTKIQSIRNLSVT